MNFLHPFREGNGRAQREFIRSLALEKGWKLYMIHMMTQENLHSGS
jgi:cell filamentation protein